MHKKIILIVIGVVLVLLVILGLVFTNLMSPERTVKNYFKTVIQHKAAAATSYIIKDDTKNRALTEKWSAANKVTYKIQKGEAWREKTGVFKPYQKSLAGKYKAELDLTVDGNIKTYEFILQRKNTTNFWNIFSYLFKGWEISSIKKLS